MNVALPIAFGAKESALGDVSSSIRRCVFEHPRAYVDFSYHFVSRLE